jgi:hypothetical protein
MAADYPIKTKFPKIFPKTAYSQTWQFELKTPRKYHEHEKCIDKEFSFERKSFLMDFQEKKKKGKFGRIFDAYHYFLTEQDERETTETPFLNRFYLQKLKEKKIIDNNWKKILTQMAFKKEKKTSHYTRVANPEITIHPSVQYIAKSKAVHTKHSSSEKKNSKAMRLFNDQNISKLTKEEALCDVYPKFQFEEQKLKENILNLNKNKQVTLSSMFFILT